MCEPWRILNPNTRTYLWYRLQKGSKVNIIGACLDFALIPQGMLDQTHEVMYLAGLHTDHSAFFIGFKTTTTR